MQLENKIDVGCTDEGNLLSKCPMTCYNRLAIGWFQRFWIQLMTMSHTQKDICETDPAAPGL